MVEWLFGKELTSDRNRQEAPRECGGMHTQQSQKLPPQGMGVQVSPLAPIHARLAQRQRQQLQTLFSPRSNRGTRTNYVGVAQGDVAPLKTEVLSGSIPDADTRTNLLLSCVLPSVREGP